jgi:uncharacterized protein (DUF302 family)
VKNRHSGGDALTAQIVSQLGLTIRLNKAFDEALAQVIAPLKIEGFGVLTEIDVKDTLKKKLDVDFRSYKIFSACNPPLAYRALSTVPEVGLLPPCNVTVSYVEDSVTEVAIIDPLAMLGIVNHPDLEPVAAEARARLDRVANALQNN